MNDKIVQLIPKEVGDNFRFDADMSLEKMKGKEIASLLIIAEMADDSFEIEGNCNSGEALFLIERAKHHIVFGDGE